MSCFNQITTDKSISDFDSNEADTDKKNPYHGILTLTIQSKGADNNSTTTTRGPGRPPINDVPLDEIPETEDPVSQLLFFFHFEEVKIEANNLNHFFSTNFQCREQNRIQRIGAQFAVQAICIYFGKDLIEKVPIFWSLVKDTIKVTEDDIQSFYKTGDAKNPVNFDQANELISCLQLIECTAVAIHSSLSDNLLELLPKLNLLLRHPLKSVGFFFNQMHRRIRIEKFINY